MGDLVDIVFVGRLQPTSAEAGGTATSTTVAINGVLTWGTWPS